MLPHHTPTIQHRVFVSVCGDAGLQGLALPDALGNLEILSNPRLTNIDALGSIFLCNEKGKTQVLPQYALVGVVEVKPAQPSTSLSRCLLTTAEQASSSARPWRCVTIQKDLEFTASVGLALAMELFLVYSSSLASVQYVAYLEVVEF